MHMRFALALAGVALSLSGCAYDMYGNPYGYGYGYGPYGYGYGPYGGVSVGYYGAYGYGPYGYGGYNPFGWYGDYYYPGVGVYLYDSNHHRHVWNDTERRYWTNRAGSWHTHSGAAVTRENWSGFNHNHSTRTNGTRSWPGHP